MTSITLSHDDLMRMRTAYVENEQRAKDFLKTETQTEVKEMYKYDRAKACGMKEAIDLLLYRMDGKFPD